MAKHDTTLVLENDNDFGFTAVDSVSIKNEGVLAGRDKVDQMYRAILPLLNNLLKDADTTDMIKWPNRREKIEEFIAKLDKIRNT